MIKNPKKIKNFLAFRNSWFTSTRNFNTRRAF